MVAASRLLHAPFKTTMLNITELPVVVMTTITTTAVVVAHPNALVIIREIAVRRPAHPRPINLGATKTPTIEVLVITAGAAPPRMAMHHVPPSRSPPRLRLHLLLLRLPCIHLLLSFHPLPQLHLGHPTPCILRVNNHCFLNQAASQLYFLFLSATVFLRALFFSTYSSSHLPKMNSPVGISWHIPSPSDNDSDEPLAPPHLGKAESSGDDDRAFEENEGSYYHPTVQHMQPLVSKAFRQHVYDKSNNYHITPIKPPETHYRIRTPHAPWAQDNTRTSPQDTAEELFDPNAPPVANPADAWRAGLVPTHDHFAFHVGLVDSSFSLKVSYDESSAPNVYKSDYCPQLSQDRIIDLGATASCTPHKSYFRLSKFRSCSMTLTVGDGGQLPILGYGPVDLTVLSRNITKGPDHHSEPHFLSLPFGLYCPNLKFNLLSVRHAVSSGYQVKFDHPEHCLFILDKTYYFRAAVNILGLYSFSATEVPPGSPLPPLGDSRLPNDSLLRRWHERLGHPSATVFRSLVADHPELSGYRTRTSNLRLRRL
ncbi:hypothetical protein DYB30_011798 [Aphanomyces astaci]|uniref:GAG-pre-integrase domain-containing protein n=1 Tax=Aphanomyces astaci TaxID=112090 RepID=A0A397F4A1_APHAT|nr:hypothetical protein DYB30_011798 [Aphanomyces astaci]RHZ07489.1 hypothetical protein DYB31_006776 [Aphanomyces astaci]